MQNDRPLTKDELRALDEFADKLFGQVGIDIEFTRHFLDRVNDPRNKKQITLGELAKLFKEIYHKWGKPIKQMGPDAEAVMKDLQTKINLPFVLVWDSRAQELDLIAKSVMRKDKFGTSNRVFAVEDSPESVVDPEDMEVYVPGLGTYTVKTLRMSIKSALEDLATRMEKAGGADIRTVNFAMESNVIAEKIKALNAAYEELSKNPEYGHVYENSRNTTVTVEDVRKTYEDYVSMNGTSQEEFNDAEYYNKTRGRQSNRKRFFSGEAGRVMKQIHRMEKVVSDLKSLPSTHNINPTMIDTLLSLLHAASDELKSKTVNEGIETGRDVINLVESYLIELGIIKPKPSETAGIDRDEMPQIHSGAHQDFFKFIKDTTGVATSKVTVKASTLSATQGEFKDEKIKKAIDTMTSDQKSEKEIPPIIISSDNFVIDGHHRWLAALNLDTTLDAYRVNTDWKSVIELAKKFPQTTFKDIDNKVVTAESVIAMYRQYITESNVTNEHGSFLTDELKKNIETIYDRGIYAFGLRVMSAAPDGVKKTVKIGDPVDHSFSKYDDIGDEELDGVSAIGFPVDLGEVDDENYFNELVKHTVTTYGGIADQVVVIAGNHNVDEVHNDYGEVVINNAHVIHIFGTSSEVRLHLGKYQPSIEESVIAKYRQYIIEEDIGSWADHIESKYNLTAFFVSDRRDEIELTSLIVGGEKKQGTGTAVMKELIEYADKHGKRIVLSPAQKDSHHGTTSRARLIKFYKRFGFVENKGHNKDFSISHSMYREPSSPVNEEAGGVGKIVKGVNTTKDVGTDAIKKQAAKFGNKVDSGGNPPLLSTSKKKTSPNTLFNLGMAESTNDNNQKLNVQSFANTIKEKYDLKDLWLVSLDNRNAIELSSIIVGKDSQKQGTGTKAMEEIVAFAETHGRILVLDPGLLDKKHGTTSQARLRKFYKRFGFIENKGRNKNYEFKHMMIRYPNNKINESTDVLNNPKFKRWFGKSKVVDEQGNPLEVYHGTKGDFTKFRTPAWFSPDKKYADAFSAEWGDGIRDENSKVMDVFLRIENPIYTDDWDITEGKAFDDEWRKEQEAAGHDGIIFSDDGEVEYIIFHPNQVKAVVSNSFDDTSDDINEEVEQVSEIKLGGSGIEKNWRDSEEITNMAKHAKLSHIGEIEGYKVYIERISHIEVFLKDPKKDIFVGHLLLEVYDRDSRSYIATVAFDPSIQGKGLAAKLYAYVIDKLDITIISDISQTKGSKSLWEQLSKLPGINVYGWNGKHDFFIWDPDEDPDEEIYNSRQARLDILADVEQRSNDLVALAKAGEIDMDIASEKIKQINDRAGEQISQLVKKPESSMRLIATKEIKVTEHKKVTMESVTSMYQKFVKENKTSVNEIVADTSVGKKYGDVGVLDPMPDLTPTGDKISGLQVYVKSPSYSNDIDTVAVKDGDEVIGALWLHDLGFGKETNIVLKSKYHGKGIAHKMYVYAIEQLGMTLVSDLSQTKGSETIWRKLAKTPGVFVYAWAKKR